MVDGLFPVTIGKVTVHYDPGANPPKVKFCKDDPSWSSGYVFTPITATMANGFQHPPVFDKSLGEKTNEDFILVSTPVSESIKINFGANFEALNDCSLQIHDLAGRIVLQDKSSVINNEITVFFEQHPPGIYILTVRAKGITKTVKVIKI
jgi:hypothetical protein